MSDKAVLIGIRVIATILTRAGITTVAGFSIANLDNITDESGQYIRNIQIGDALINHIHDIEARLVEIRHRLDNEVAGLPTSPQWARELSAKLGEVLQNLQGVNATTHLAETWGWIQTADLAIREVLGDIERDWQRDVPQIEARNRGFLAPFFALVAQFAKDTQQRLASELADAQSAERTLNALSGYNG
ncbi:hypothetical protein BJY04DRAFT_194030 [Aspergillus karnatakaensis]|uniref:uncharacterized protein n=1 Tax=Aspergillus karnatakaensis TaxID=1810916 RepID=UPI003CCCD7B7